MIGAIIGDQSGSPRELQEIKLKKLGNKLSYEDRKSILNNNIPLITENSIYTDDTELTIAIADAILHNQEYEKYIKIYGLRAMDMGKNEYGMSRFGPRFCQYLNGLVPGDSYGNGAAMRLGAIGLYYDSLEDILENCYLSTVCSHNTEEALTSSKAVGLAMYYAKKGYPKEYIKQVIEKACNYDLSMNLDELSHNYVFHSKASLSVPQAIFAFLESNDFEDAIRKAISIGGDSDTIAAITGSISELYYEVPEYLKEQALIKLPNYMIEVIDKFYKKHVIIKK